MPVRNESRAIDVADTIGVCSLYLIAGSTPRVLQRTDRSYRFTRGTPKWTPT